jgi:hypothetical protein
MADKHINPILPVMRKRHADDVRAKIQVSHLLTRLTGHIEGKNDLSPTQLKAIEMLLDRALPRLSSIDVNVDGEVRNYVINGEPLTINDWQERYSLGPSIGTSESAN